MLGVYDPLSSTETQVDVNGVATGYGGRKESWTFTELGPNFRYYLSLTDKAEKSPSGSPSKGWIKCRLYFSFV